MIQIPNDMTFTREVSVGLPSKRELTQVGEVNKPALDALLLRWSIESSFYDIIMMQKIYISGCVITCWEGRVIMKTLDLKNNEQLIFDGVANKWQTFGSKGGKLFLTNQRLVFIAHVLNFGSKFDEILLSDVVTSGNTFKFKTSSNLVSFNLDIYTKSKGRIGFVVTRKQKDLWIDKIGQAISEFVVGNIVIQTDNTQILNTTQNIPQPQIKVVNCKHCGAYVVVMGGLAKCEYCGTPTT